MALARERPKAPLCKGGWQNRHFGTDFDWGIVAFYNPSDRIGMIATGNHIDS